MDNRCFLKTILAGSALVCWMISISCGVQTETASDKTKDIKKLLEVSGIQDQLTYMKDGVLNSYSQIITMSNPAAPNEFWSEYNSLIGEREMNEMIDRIVPVYDRHMSHDAIKKLIVMFENPFWQEWKDKMPKISREAGIIGSQWAMETAQSKEFLSRLDGLLEKYCLEKMSAGNSGN